ncbi:MAG TPA: hypothetical protein VJN96_09850 [Vicinamibacterales bacterium]|nr:hypothetical protein [Vicinamibacterales bacterium]
MNRPPFHVYRVNLPEGLTDVVSYLPEDIVFNLGLAADAIIGRCTELLGNGVSITADNFQPNRRFVDLLHHVIATHAPGLPELQAEARRQHSGWVYVIDARTPTPAGDVPPHDILGRFGVRHGAVVPQSYEPNANHRLFSSNGLFQLDSRLHSRLLERVLASASGSS